MDIGNAQHEEHDKCQCPPCDIDYASRNTQCHVCEGWGHFARECPSAPTKGKGGGNGDTKGGKGNAKGKAYGKGGMP